MIKFKKEPDDKEEIRKLLHPYVKKWFFGRFSELSLPQRFGVKPIHERRNILISAPTGGTKTLTSFLSILNHLVTFADQGILEDKVYCVYVSPLKALNNDIEKNLKGPLAGIEEAAGKSLGIRISVRTGDTTASEKATMLKRPPHILITTPESLGIVLSSMKFREHLNSVEYMIVDEIHSLAESKRGTHLALSLERLSRLSPKMARIGLSATVSPIEDVARFLVGNRACEIADVPMAKEMELSVVSPLSDLADATALDLSNSLYDLLDRLIQEHKTTLIFTNTRSGTERIVHHLKESFPKNYGDNPILGDAQNGRSSPLASSRIGAHHGSLSKEHRFDIEERLRKGELKAVVTSTSLELGIDIGYIDLVILLGSPKSSARALQRIGRSGHNLGGKTKGIFIPLDRDDLVECAVLLSAAKEGRIDKVRIPKNALDVLAQQIIGIALAGEIHVEELFSMVKMSYPYSDLPIKRFFDVLEFLSGRHESLRKYHIYPTIAYDTETKMIAKRGRLSRVNYMTNIGTIPEESYALVKIGDKVLGKVDENFLERLKRNDVFVLGGETYQFMHAKGLTLQVRASAGKLPTVPRWSSEAMPLSFELASEISRLRRLMDERLRAKESDGAIIDFIKGHLSLDKDSARAILAYFRKQRSFSEIPHDGKIVLEHYVTKDKKFAVFHTMYGRRVNELLLRATIYAIMRSEHREVESGVSDSGFFVAYPRKLNVLRAFNLIKSADLPKVMEKAIDDSEILRRRFRHCAARSLMILRNYKGKQRLIGRQQVSSMILLKAVRKVSKDFPILAEARREVLEDLMDIGNARKVIEGIEKGKIKITEVTTTIPSPFASNLVLAGISELMSLDERMLMLRNLDSEITRRISEPKKEEKPDKSPIDYYRMWHTEDERKKEEKLDREELLRHELVMASRKLNLDANTVYAISELIDGKKEGFRDDFLAWLANFADGSVPKAWGDEIAKFLIKKAKELS